MKELRTYRAKNGKEPFADWLDAVKDKKVAAHVNNRLYRLSLGHKGDCKVIGQGVCELRIHYGAGYRVYFAEHKNMFVILLLGGSKASQQKDIRQAIAYWQDYKRVYHEKR